MLHNTRKSAKLVKVKKGTISHQNKEEISQLYSWFRVWSYNLRFRVVPNLLPMKKEINRLS